MYMTVLSVFRQGLDQLESPATSVLHWHPNPVSDIIFSHDGKMIFLFCLLACIIYVYLIVSGSYKSLYRLKKSFSLSNTVLNGSTSY